MYRKLDKLTPNFRKKVELFLYTVGDEIFITETWRSKERQAQLYKDKFSKIKVSNHQKGLAIDIGFRGYILYPKDLNRWQKVAEIAKKFGIDWGYGLWGWDRPHFQDNGKILDHNKLFMSFYKEVFDRENPTGSSIVKDMDGALKKCINKDGTLNSEEFFWLNMVLLERIKK